MKFNLFYRQQNPISLALFAMLTLPPGVLTLAFSRLGAGVFVQVAGLWLLLLSHYLWRRRLYKVPLVPVITLLALMLAYFFMPRYFDAFSAGGKSRETLGILATILSIYTLVFQVASGSKNRLITVEFLESAIITAAFGTGTLLLVQYVGLLGGHEGAFAYAGFGHRIHSGIFCAIGLFLVVRRFISVPPLSIQRLVYGVCMAILLIATVMAASRSVMVVVILAFYFAAIVRSGFRGMLKITFLVAAFVFAIMYYGPAAEKFLQSDFSSGRIDLWQQLIPNNAREALYGRGVGYMWSLNQFDISQYGGYVSEENESIYAHNDYLFFLVEMGIAGVTLWMLFLIYHLKLAVKAPTVIDTSVNVMMPRASLAFVAISVLIVESVDTVIFGGRNAFCVGALLAMFTCQLKASAQPFLSRKQNS